MTRIWIATKSHAFTVPRGMPSDLFWLDVKLRLVQSPRPQEFAGFPTAFLVVEFEGEATFVPEGRVAVKPNSSANFENMFEPGSVLMIEDTLTDKQVWNFLACKKCCEMSGEEDGKKPRQDGTRGEDMHVHCKRCNRGWIIEYV